MAEADGLTWLVEGLAAVLLATGLLGVDPVLHPASVAASASSAIPALARAALAITAR